MISIVIPAYNEEEGIAEIYRRIVESASAWSRRI